MTERQAAELLAVLKDIAQSLRKLAGRPGPASQ